MNGGGVNQSAVFAVMLLMTAAICFVFTLIALSRKRHGDEPRCGRCNYDLRGMPAKSSRCPECGSDLSAANAVHTGDVLPRYRKASTFAAIAIFLLALSGREGWLWARGFNWLPYEPLSWVFAEAKPPGGSSAALGELYDRVATGRIADSQIAPVIAVALAEQSGTGSWDDKWARILEALHRAGRLPVADWDRYVDSLITFDMQVRPQVNLNAQPVIKIDQHFNDRRAAVSLEGTWQVRSITINGKAISTSPYNGRFSASEHSYNTGTMRGDIEAKLRSAGRQNVTAIIDLSVVASLTNCTTRPADERHPSATLANDFVVGPPAELSIAERAANRQSMLDRLVATSDREAGKNTLTLNAKSLPYRIAATLSLVGPDGKPVQYPARGSEEAYDFAYQFTQLPNKVQGSSYELPDPCPPVFDVVLTPNAKEAAKGLDSSPAWPEPLAIRGVRMPTTQQK